MGHFLSMIICQVLLAGDGLSNNWLAGCINYANNCLISLLFILFILSMKEGSQEERLNIYF